MANKNFKVRHGLDVDGNIAATDLTLTGNLTVNGTTTTLNTATLAVEDNIVVLNSNVTGTPATDAGIEVERGDSTNSSLFWKESDDKWYQNRGGTETVIPVSTTELTEGTNQYFTQARARTSVSVTDSGGDGSLSYDNSTGVVTYTGPSAAEVRAHFSAVDSGGDGSFAYNSGTGAFTYTGPSAAEVRAHFSGGTGVAITDGSIAIGQAVGTGDSPTFAGATLGNITVGLTDNNTITTTDTNGNLTVTPNGTGKLVVSTETDTNISDGNYLLGNIAATRNTSYVTPTGGLSTTSGQNGFTAASSTGYSAGFQAVYYSGDTTSGTASSAGYTGRGASGTNSVPGPAANNQVLLTLNADGYATTGFANNIATVNSGGGTTSISPAQIQLYAREAFADNGTTVTAAGTGFRVRGFQTATSMSTANRLNFIDHHLTTATYKASTFNIQSGASATNHAVFATTGHTIGNVDNPTVFIRSSGATAGIRPVSFQRNTQTATATPANSDGASFRFQTAGSSGTVYNLAEFAGFYGSTGDSGLQIGVANGDQTTSTMTQVIPFQTKLSETRIKATTTPTATAGGNTLTDVAVFAPATASIKSDAITLESNGGTDYLVLDTNKALFSKPVRTTVTTATVAQGGTHTPAATALNSIVLTVTAGSGTTTIDVSNLTVAGENGVYDILVYNNSGSSISPNGFTIVNGGNTVLSHSGTIADGARAVFEINCIDVYATAVFVTNAV